MDYARQFIFASNPLRLSVRQWLVAGGVLGIVLVGVPCLALRLDPFVPGPDYRLPYDFSQDYWQCGRWIDDAAARDAVLVMGDSVVWGEYVAPGDALSGELNRLVGTQRFANLGVNGLHPVALLGLLQRLGGPIRDRDVVLVLNLLWMSSPRHDLRAAPAAGEGEQVVLNHPALVPQFWPVVPRYGAGFEQRAGTVVGRRVPFLSWASHLDATGAYGDSLLAESAEAPGAGGPQPGAGPEPEPRIDDPTPAACRGLFVAVPPPSPSPHGQPLTWEARGVPVSRIDWPLAEQSLQWRFFRGAVEYLLARGNRVCVLVAPFNPYVQVPESRARYDGLVADMVGWLEAQGGLVVIRAEPLPGNEYADASHPLAAGYARLAGELAADPRFRPWFTGGAPALAARQ